MELTIGKTEGTILGIQHAVRCGTAGGVWGAFHGLHPWLFSSGPSGAGRRRFQDTEARHGGFPRVAPVAPSKMRVRKVDPGADVDVRGTAGQETHATFMRGCEPKDHE